MRVLLDTCVLSELRRPRPQASVQEAIRQLEEDDLYVSVISIGEIVKGISLRKEDALKQELQAWLQRLERFYEDRLLPLDLETVHIWGELSATAQKQGRTLPVSDGLIAASAHRHGLHLMTRNTSDFEVTGVLLLNPWD